MDPAALIASNTPPTGPKPAQSYDDSKVDFPIPDGFVAPDDIKSGDDFQALGTFKIKDEGTMCLVAVDGAQVTKAVAAPVQPPAPPAGAIDALKQGLTAAGVPA